MLPSGNAELEQHIFQTLVEGQKRSNLLEYNSVSASVNLVLFVSDEPDYTQQVYIALVYFLYNAIDP